MSYDHVLLHIVRKQKEGIPQGIYSTCSANEFVIEAALEYGKKKGTPILLEATSNQVNQFGGYTGMKPRDFARFVCRLADAIGIPRQSIILGGDHLGPNPWRREAADAALAKACTLVRDYVLAGFTKIHLDASMYLGDDQGDRKQALDPEIVAKRTALLGEAAEDGYAQLIQSEVSAQAPVYIIGSEVPIPGGVEKGEAQLKVTEPGDFHRTVSLTKEMFLKKGLEDAWARVVGVVVQPGVEFGDDFVHEYDSQQAQELIDQLERYPNLIFEGHSTDYQQPHHLKDMVADGVGILKVGPELTFAFREALFLLHHLEQELLENRAVGTSDLINVVEEVMLAKPENWRPYYRGTEQELRFARKYSLSDRIRYYWPQPEVAQAIRILLRNLDSEELPLTLLSQYFPIQYGQIRAGMLRKDPRALIKGHITRVYEKYHWATQP